MKLEMKGLSLGALGALLLGAAPAARAQDGNAIGNPQLRDFQLRPQQQQPPLTQPVQQAPPVVVAPPPPVAARPQPAPPPQQQQAPQVQPQGQQATPGPRPAAPRQQAPAQAQPQPGVQPQTEAPPQPGAQPQVQAPTEAVPPPITEPLPTASTPPTQETGPGIPWLYVLPAAAALALIGLALLRRRRRRGEAEPYEEIEAGVPAPLPAAAAEPVAPRPEPAPRPWLELTLKAERASATLTETIVNFELEIANTGKSAARNLRIDVKMFNAGAEQDKEIGAFFRTAGRESTKLNLPGIAPESVGVINGQVTMPRDEMRAVVLDEKYLFIPVIAVNALYDWGEGRTGQSSKSYVVGRELQQPSEKMGAFRVDQGPRVWRTVGQRQHSLARKV
jgi:MYXO-CTERM domain-containing protein